MARIGRGSQGSVYTVRSLLDGSVAVLKRLQIGDEIARASALREAEHMLRVQHAAVVGCRECFVDGDELCIVMEYCEGGDLRLRIKLARMGGSLFAEEQVLMWLAQLALALHHVHERGLLHRDLKTENVFISSAGLLKLGDFGIARGLGASELAATVVGTPYYMSPELFRGQPYAHEADVWALGCILVEMCSQCLAFEADNFNALALRVMRGAHQSLPPKYSAELHALVRLLLNVNPAGRPSVAELLCTPILRRHIASYAVAALSGFALEAQLASQPLAALRSQLSSAGLGVLLDSITPPCSSPLRLPRHARPARPYEAGSAWSLANDNGRAAGGGSGDGARMPGAASSREPHYWGEDLVQQLLDDEHDRLRVEMALRRLEGERRARQEKKKAEAEARRKVGVAGHAMRPGPDGGGGVCANAADGSAHSARAPPGRSAAYGRRAAHPKGPGVTGLGGTGAESNDHRTARHGGRGPLALTPDPSTGEIAHVSPPAVRLAREPSVRLLAEGEVPQAAFEPAVPLANFTSPAMHGRRHRSFERASNVPDEGGRLGAHEESEMAVEIEHSLDLAPEADDVFAGFRMPNTAQDGEVDLGRGVGQDREAGELSMPNDGAGLTTHHGPVEPAIQYARMVERGGQPAVERGYVALRDERTATAAKPSMSAKERVLARRAQQKAEEEAAQKVALDTARRQYFSERQAAVQMQRDQYRGREGLSQALHRNTDKIDATLSQVHLLTEPLTPQKLRFVHAHKWGQAA